MEDKFRIVEEPVESSEPPSDVDDRKLINPKRVAPLKSSGRVDLSGINFTLRPPNPLDPRDKLYRERIEQMTLDNQSLQRRLN